MNNDWIETLIDEYVRQSAVNKYAAIENLRSDIESRERKAFNKGWYNCMPPWNGWNHKEAAWEAYKNSPEYLEETKK